MATTDLIRAETAEPARVLIFSDRHRGATPDGATLGDRKRRNDDWT
jgi:hypothetical protein